MVSLLSGADLLPAGRMRGHPQGERILAFHRLYGADMPDYRFYVFESGAGVYAAGLYKYGVLLLYAPELPGREEAEEVLEFWQSLGCPALSVTGAAGEAFLQLPGLAANSGPVMRFAGPLPPEDAGRPSVLADYRALYSLLNRASPGCFEERDYPLWLCELSHAVRHGEASVFIPDEAVCPRGMAAATAMCLGGEGVIVTQVAVDPAWQGKGLGRAVMEQALGVLSRKGKPIYVYLEKQNMGFYEKLGFVPVDRWYEIERGKEH